MSEHRSSTTAATEIVDVVAEPFDVRLTESFGIAGGGHAIAQNILVRVTLRDGTIGLGEGAPLPAFNGETQAAVLATVPAFADLVRGRDVRRLRALLPALREASSGVASALCAVETALVDALLRHHRISAWAFYGGHDDTLKTDVTIPTGTVERVREIVPQRIAQGFSTIKIKVGAGDLDEDLARIRAIADISPSLAIIADANAGLVEADALALVRGLRRAGITLALFEQPVARDDHEGLAALNREPGVLVAADESAFSAAAVADLLRKSAVGAVNIKLMKTGLDEALSIARLVRAHGADLMIGGMVESSLAMGMSAAFAAGLGGFRFVDLDTPLFFTDDPFVGGYTMQGATLTLDTASVGHGVSPRVAEASRPG